MTRIVGVLDLGHFFGFAVLTACLAWAWPTGKWIGALLAIVLAGVGEVAQPWFGRTGDWRDFAFGTLGALAGWVLVRGAMRPRSRWRVAGHGLAVLGLAAWPMVCCMPDVLDTWTEWRAFPVLCDFQSPWQARRWLTRDVAIGRVAEEDGCGWVGRFDLAPGRDGSVMAVLFPLRSDWSGYRRLVWDVQCAGEPLRIGFLLRTGWEKGKTGGASFEGVCDRGAGRIVFDFERARAAGPTPPDLTQIHSLYLFVRGLRGPRPLFVRKIYLE
jgi:hypothetical protein